MAHAGRADTIRRIFAAISPTIAIRRERVERRFPLHQSLRRCHRQADLFRAVLEEQATGSSGTSWSGFSSRVMKPSSPIAAWPKVTARINVSQYRVLRLRRLQGEAHRRHFGAAYENGMFVKQPG